jgi:hypothetical protein
MFRHLLYLLSSRFRFFGNVEHDARTAVVRRIVDYGFYRFVVVDVFKRKDKRMRTGELIDLLYSVWSVIFYN